MCHTAGVKPRLQSKPASTDLDLQPYSLVCRLMVYIPVIYVIIWITTHLPKDETLCWPSWLNYSGQFTHKMVTCQPWGAQGRESTSAKDRRPNHGAMAPRSWGKPQKNKSENGYWRRKTQETSPKNETETRVTAPGKTTKKRKWNWVTGSPAVAAGLVARKSSDLLQNGACEFFQTLVISTRLRVGCRVAKCFHQHLLFSVVQHRNPPTKTQKVKHHKPYIPPQWRCHHRQAFSLGRSPRTHSWTVTFSHMQF